MEVVEAAAEGQFMRATSYHVENDDLRKIDGYRALPAFLAKEATTKAA